MTLPLDKSRATDSHFINEKIGFICDGFYKSFGSDTVTYITG